MSERGFLGELLHRRVLQYIGLYIGGVWLGIEIGEWLTEQFALPARLTTYIFVFMAILLPSVAFYAWNHGAPGHDGPNKAELFVVPLNVLLAVFGVMSVPDKAPVAATAEAQALAAIDGDAEMPPLPSSQRLMAFFFANNTAEAPDWYVYGFPLLLTEDLERASPAFTALTPFDSDSTLAALRQAGFESAQRVPQSLQLQIARQRQYSYLLRGELVDGPDGALTVRYTLQYVQSGEVRASGERTFAPDELLAAVDDVSAVVRGELEAAINEDIVVTDLPVSESMSESLEALRAYTEARIAEDIDSDRALAGELLTQAVLADPAFAEAHGRLGLFHYLNGDASSAEAAIDEALRYDFRLSRGSEYRLKINKAAINGDFEAARDIARTWARAEPVSVAAYRRLADLNMITGLDLDEALGALQRVRELNPMAVETLKGSANIQQQRGDFEAAMLLLDEYTSKAPDDAEGLIQLAQLQASQGKFDEALASYREASFIDERSVQPELGAINVLIRRGDYAQAEDRLTALAASELTDEQRLHLTTVQVSLYTGVGQYREAVRLMEAVEPISERLNGPLLTTLQVTASRVAMNGYLAEQPTAIADELDALAQTLQPPWPGFVAVYKAELFAIHEEPALFIENMETLEAFAATQPANGNLQFMTDSHRALAAVYDGDTERAVELVNRAIEGSRSSLLAVVVGGEMLRIQSEMYDVLRRAGAVPEAIAGLEAIISSYPGLAIAHLRLAQAYFESGRLGKARESLNVAKSIWAEADPEFLHLRTLSSLDSALDERA